MNTTDERNVDPILEMSQLAEKFLPLASWNFKESYRSKQSGNVIYDSNQCRVNLVWGGWDQIGGFSISIYYGRLHAENESQTMNWSGETCHCWHRVEHLLHFLDGRAPVEAAKLSYSHSITAPFYEEEFRQKFYRRQPAWLARMHATIWSHYGKRFFDDIAG